MLVARAPSGTVKVYPPALNHHVQGVLDWSMLLARRAFSLLRRARKRLARAIAESLRIEGLLAVDPSTMVRCL